MVEAVLAQLQELARAFRIQTSYHDIGGTLRHATPESLLGTLKALGAAVDRMQDAGEALLLQRRSRLSRRVEPVVPAWSGSPVEVQLNLREGGTPPLECTIEFEQGERQVWQVDAGSLPVRGSEYVDGVRYNLHSMKLPGNLPLGYHRLIVASPRAAPASALVISAPIQARPLPEATPGEADAKRWGLFLPLYALYTGQSAGIGDFADLDLLTKWAKGMGGSFVATLPMLASFLDDPLEYSPYAPVSRLFWNEIYISLDQALAMIPCPEAAAIASSGEFRESAAALRDSGEVDYRRTMALKRRVLEQIAHCFYSSNGESDPRFQRFLESSPDIESYARFRACVEHRKTPWTKWPEAMRNGVLSPGDYEDRARLYHRFVQWLAHEQMDALAGLYLDLPLGVHPSGYDVWKQRHLFAEGAAAGAPPDDFFTLGQNWGFPPMHPDRLREDGYRYFIAYIRHHLRYAGLLRIDHIMGFHRLFWIPDGARATEGVYVRYEPSEFYAILNLESQRTGSSIIGENLGTVPKEVDEALERHRIYGMYVGQFRVRADPDRAADPVDTQVSASLNTHDAPTFAAFWRALDLEDRLQLGLLTAEEGRREHVARAEIRRALVEFLTRRRLLAQGAAGEHAVLSAWLAYIAGSPATMVVVNVEDLWLETRRQNMPGTGSEQPNWKRKARHSLEGFQDKPEVLSILERIARLRSGHVP